MEQTPDQMMARIEALESAVIALVRVRREQLELDGVVEDLRLRALEMPRNSAMFEEFDTRARNLE